MSSIPQRSPQSAPAAPGFPFPGRGCPPGSPPKAAAAAACKIAVEADLITDLDSPAHIGREAQCNSGVSRAGNSTSDNVGDDLSGSSLYFDRYIISTVGGSPPITIDR